MDIKLIQRKVQEFRANNPNAVKILEKRLKPEAKEKGEKLVELVDSNLRYFFKAAIDSYISDRGVKEVIEWASKKDSVNNICSFIQSQFKKDWVKIKYPDLNALNAQQEKAVDEKDLYNFNDDEEETIDSKPVEFKRVDSLISSQSKELIKNLAKIEKVTQSVMAGRILEEGLRVYGSEN